MKRTLFSISLVLAAFGDCRAATVLNEFQPNPDGTDPSVQSVELLGNPSSLFDLWILSIESDPGSSLGRVDRVNNVTGTFDSNGLGVVSIPDLENPSNTVILTDAFSGDTTTDIDPLDLGAAATIGELDLSAFGSIMDALGIPDEVADQDTLYGGVLGFNDLTFNGEFEPLNVFRDGTSGAWYQTVAVDFGNLNEHVGIFAQGGGPELDPSNFSSDPLVTSFGTPNPSIPEPSACLLGGLALLAFLRRRRD